MSLGVIVPARIRQYCRNCPELSETDLHGVLAPLGRSLPGRLDRRSIRRGRKAPPLTKTSGACSSNDLRTPSTADIRILIGSFSARAENGTPPNYRSLGKFSPRGENFDSQTSVSSNLPSRASTRDVLAVSEVDIVLDALYPQNDRIFDPASCMGASQAAGTQRNPAVKEMRAALRLALTQCPEVSGTAGAEKLLPLKLCGWLRVAFRAARPRPGCE
jgi:hypothetical protein